MSSKTDIAAVTEKITTYLSRIKHLENELDKAKKEIIQINKSLLDSKDEIKDLTTQKEILLAEKKNYEEAIRHFKVLGEKDKKEMEKMKKDIKTLKKENKALTTEIEGLQKEIESLEKPDS
jgi:chromosome segregation ATPase